MARAWRFELVCRRASASSRVRRRWATFPSSRRCVLASPSRVPPRWWIRSNLHPTGRPLNFSAPRPSTAARAHGSDRGGSRASTPRRRLRRSWRSSRIVCARGEAGDARHRPASGRWRDRPRPRVGTVDDSRFFARRADSRAFAVSSRSRRDLVAASRGASTCAAPSLRSRASTLTRSPPGRSPRAGWSGRGRGVPRWWALF